MKVSNMPQRERHQDPVYLFSPFWSLVLPRVCSHMLQVCSPSPEPQKSSGPARGSLAAASAPFLRQGVAGLPLDPGV